MLKNYEALSLIFSTRLVLYRRMEIMKLLWKFSSRNINAFATWFNIFQEWKNDISSNLGMLAVSETTYQLGKRISHTQRILH